eukprot:CAMPEP_0114576432 /NCGR_PEP_ID=MMETSP0125-20121206/1195_1 /TAXON_ID=485358 ORGANISM="Aristerostoma sp., Strain ATCC 50986" /NCGR_SAMPLE_ID=MMETSP0125 /ASSEMBLY_ACC=CAM_ASM_000245 /LENGTH=110 /DNA_ID=CAMNT_0001764943 /DNA_START=266 /DNA_END=598 /DNA_ORIENTATION=+
MLIYYNYYSDSKGMMNFEKFTKFCKDFSLFPDIIAKGKISNFFYTLAAIHTQAEGGNNDESAMRGRSLMGNSKFGANGKAIDQPDNDVIDQHLFIEALALCAFEIPYSDP